jgi:regulator of RNase E activity RraA
MTLKDFQTTDLCDAFENEVQVAEPLFRSYGGARCAGGQIRTLKLFEDNALVRETLATPGQGAVLVIDSSAELVTATFLLPLLALPLRPATSSMPTKMASS